MCLVICNNLPYLGQFSVSSLPYLEVETITSFWFSLALSGYIMKHHTFFYTV
jgi:hypothetical protein